MPSTLQVQIAIASDAIDIAAMSRRLIEQGLPWTWRPERVARAIAAAHTNVAVVRAHKTLLGFGIMEYLDEDAHLVLFAVRADSQRQGIGSAILQWLESCAIVAGAKRIRVEARRDNGGARSFYNEHGYHEQDIQPHMYSGLMDGIRLEKWLRPGNEAEA